MSTAATSTVSASDRVRPRRDSRPAPPNGRSWRHGSHLERPGIGWTTARFPARHGHQGTGLRIEQVIDNTPSRTVAAHERIGFTEKWLALGFAKTQRREHVDRGTGLADPHDRHKSDAGCPAASGLPTKVSL